MTLKAAVVACIACASVVGLLTVKAQETPSLAVSLPAHFVMTGHCPNGEAYRLSFYAKPFDGAFNTFYDYEGPVGTGTVQSATEPRVMAARVCRLLAEIINAKYWE